jgi:hypothetical protein
MVKKAEKQIVAGWNVFVTFSYPNSADIYEIVVYIPLPHTGNPPELTSIKKNGSFYKPEPLTPSPKIS